MKRNIYFILIFVTLFSCMKTIDFDDEGLANQAVVNSIISPDKGFSAYLTKSSSILEDRQNNPPLQGTLDLYEDEILIRQFPSQLGGFSDPDLKPKSGKSYRIVVNSIGKTLESETTIPNPVEIISVDTMTVKNEYGSNTTQYKLRIKDPSGDDYYRIVIMNETLSPMTFIDSLNYERIAYYKYNMQYSIFSDDPVFKSVYNNFGDELIDYGPANEYSIFPDTYFQGKEYTIQFQSSSWYNYYSNPYYYGGSKPIYERNTIHVQKLSKDLYNYMKYIKLYDHYRDNPFAEPVPVYSNVKNGAGIFAGFNDDVRLEFMKINVPYSMDTIVVVENTFPYSDY